MRTAFLCLLASIVLIVLFEDADRAAVAGQVIAKVSKVAAGISLGCLLFCGVCPLKKSE